MNDDLNLTQIAARVGMSCVLTAATAFGIFHGHKICCLGLMMFCSRRGSLAAQRNPRCRWWPAQPLRRRSSGLGAFHGIRMGVGVSITLGSEATSAFVG